MHVSFDLDGVLLDSESDLDWLDRALSATLREFDRPDTAENRRLLSPWRLGTFEESAEELGVAVQELWETRNHHYTGEKVAAIETGEIGPFPDVAVVADLAADHELSVLSNSPQVVVETFVEAHLDADHFAALVGRGDTLADLRRLKPDTHLYDRLRERVGADLDAARLVYVGDTESDEQFARAVGAAYVGVRREDGEGLDSLRELPAALDELAVDPSRRE